MKKITEQQLIESARALRDYSSILEAGVQPAPQPNTDLSWNNIGKAAGNVWQGVKNTAGAVGNAATGAYNAVSGAASDVASGFNSAQTPATGVAAQQAPTNKWPTTPQEIKVFQQANGLKPDGAIGPKTMQALASKGIQPPAGFQMAGPKKAAATTKPADIMAQSPDEAEDERIAQNTAFYNMTPQQQAMYNAGTTQQKPAAQPAPATAQPAPAQKYAPVVTDVQVDGPANTAPYDPSQQNVQVYKETADPEMTRFKNLISYKEIFENIQEQQAHVSFKDDNSLARIVHLSKKEIK